METTRRRLASASLRLAWAAISLSAGSSELLRPILRAMSTSSSAVRSGTLPISFRYMRTGSSVEMPSGMERSSASGVISCSPASCSASSPTTSMPNCSKDSNSFSYCSGEISTSVRVSSTSRWVNVPFFLPVSTISSMRPCFASLLDKRFTPFGRPAYTGPVASSKRSNVRPPSFVPLAAGWAAPP